MNVDRIRRALKGVPIDEVSAKELDLLLGKEAVNKRKVKSRHRRTKPEELTDLEKLQRYTGKKPIIDELPLEGRGIAQLDTNAEQRAIRERMSASRKEWENKAINEAADRQYRSTNPEFGEAEAIDQDRMSYLFDKQTQADRIANGNWQWMLKDARYKDNPLVKQAIAEIVERDGPQVLSDESRRLLKKRLDIRSDLSNESAIRHNRLQQELNKYQDLEDIVAKKFGNKEEGDIAAELMGMNPDTGSSMPDRLKQAIEGNTLNQGGVVINDIDDVLNNPFVDEAVKNKRLMAYSNRELSKLEHRQDLIDQAVKRDRAQRYRISQGTDGVPRAFEEMYPNERTGDYYQNLRRRGMSDIPDSELRHHEDDITDRLNKVYIQKDKLQEEMDAAMSKTSNQSEQAIIQASYIDSFNALDNQARQLNRELKIIQTKRDRDYIKDLGDSDVESIFEQFKDARQLEWEKPTPRFETENAIREAEHHKSVIRNILADRYRKISDPRQREVFARRVKDYLKDFGKNNTSY